MLPEDFSDVLFPQTIWQVCALHAVTPGDNSSCVYDAVCIMPTFSDARGGFRNDSYSLPQGHSFPRLHNANSLFNRMSVYGAATITIKLSKRLDFFHLGDF